VTPGGRIAAAIEILDAVLAGARADRTLAGWGRAHRFAGSKDRAAIADLVYAGLRRRRSLAHEAGAETGRGLMLALAAAEGRLAEFSGEGHAPPPPTAAERAALARAEPPDEDVALDVPPALADALRRSLGNRFAPVMAAMRERAPLDLRVNLMRITRAAAGRALAEEGIETLPLEAEPAALRVTEGAGRLRNSAAYRSGLVEIQDIGSQRAARLAGAQPGETVLDFCAGGGGKTLALAMHMQGQGRLIAHDANPARMDQLAIRAVRAGVRVERMTPAQLRAASPVCDLVVADLPCSGSGTWRRDPESKWRLDASALASLTGLQDRILDEAAGFVRPGGRLCAITCSLLDTENEHRIAAFLRRRPDFATIRSQQLTPPSDGDGFFTCLLQRAAAAKG